MNNHDAAFSKFEQKLDRLLLAYSELQKKQVELEAQLKETKEQLLDTQLSVREWRRKYDTLKMAKAFGQTEEDKKAAYMRITNLVREVDSCIKLLKQ